METLASPCSDEPTLKKFKTSTTSDDEDCATVTVEKKPRYKRRKVAILFGYCGVGYQGMQKNIGAKTIEGELEEALFLAGAVPEQDRGRPKRFDWSRSARTDKGVSAAGQVIAGRFYVDPPGLIDRLHSHLSPQFRIYGYKRVTTSFNAQTFCDRRRYVYLLPVFALDPSYNDTESVLVHSSIWSNSEPVYTESVLVHSSILSNSEPALQISETKEAESITESNGVLAFDEKTDVNKFYYGDKERKRFNKILKCYEGTHNFHNFATRIKAEDPSSQRFIVSFTANDTVNVDSIEFVKCEVVGQSFMLHQIRKLIGFAVLIMRNVAPESLMDTALQKDIRIDVPTAPEVGLYLDECFFTPYNKKWKDVHEEVSMKDYAKEAEDFKIKHIYSYIASTEHKERVVSLWLHSLNRQNYYHELSAVTNSKTDLKNSEVQITNHDISPEVANDSKSNTKTAEV